DDAADLLFVEAAALAQRERDVVEHRQRGVQRAVLEQHAHAPARVAHLLCARIVPGNAKYAHDARLRALESEDHAQQLGLAAARAADQGHHFVAPYLQVEIAVQDRVGADRVDQALDLDAVALVVHQPMFLSMIANTASRMMTPVIAATTERVTPTA